MFASHVPQLFVQSYSVCLLLVLCLERRNESWLAGPVVVLQEQNKQDQVVNAAVRTCPPLFFDAIVSRRWSGPRRVVSLEMMQPIRWRRKVA